MALDHGATDDVAVRQSRMDDAYLRPAGAGRAAAPDGGRSELAARQQRAAAAIQIRIIAVASREPVEVQIQSRDRSARAAIEEMSLAEFAAMHPSRLAGLADELAAIIATGGRR
jgi:hypothetical protein